MTCNAHDESARFDRLVMMLSHAITEHMYKSSAAEALDMTVVMDDGREQGIVGTQEVL